MSESAMELNGRSLVEIAPRPLPLGDGSSGPLVRLVEKPALEWSADRRFRVTWASGKSTFDGALSPTDLVGKRVTEAFGPVDRAMTPVEAHARALEGEDVVLRIRWGSRILEAVVTPRRNGDGEPIGAVARAFEVIENDGKLVRAETGPVAPRRPRRDRTHAAVARTS